MDVILAVSVCRFEQIPTHFSCGQCQERPAKICSVCTTVTHTQACTHPHACTCAGVYTEHGSYSLSELVNDQAALTGAKQIRVSVLLSTCSYIVVT